MPLLLRVRGWDWGYRKGSGNAASLGTPLRPLSRCRWSLQPYADSVRDSTWRWWKNKKQDQVRVRLRGGGLARPGHPSVPLSGC